MARLHFFLALAALVAVEAGRIPDLSHVRAKVDTLPDNLPWKASLKARNSLLEKNPGSRIVGGQYASPGQFPYQVAIFIDNREFCGGSIIASNWVLTAGHCGSGAYNFVIIMGSISIQQGDPSQVVMSSYQSITHPGFSMQTLQNDLTVVKLPQQIPSSATISPISLSSSVIGPGQNAVVSGWGKTSDSGDISPELKYTNLQTIDNQQCAQYYGGILYDGVVCCTSSQGTTCQGDSGGPLVISGTQIGIVSFGGQSCLSSPPAFTRVSYFINWIYQTVNSN